MASPGARPARGTGDGHESVTCVVQDVLLKAWRARATYVPEAPIAHWLMRIATTSCLTTLAARAKRGLRGIVAETIHFIGRPYLRGFNVPDQRNPLRR